MKPVRFGSYSIRSTLAASPMRSRRLKSTRRSVRLCPPPRKRTVTRPMLLRPPEEDLPSARDSKARRDVDGLARFQGHDRLLDVRTLPFAAAEHLPLALGHERVDAANLHLEQLLDRFLDLRLGRLGTDPEHDLVLLGERRRLLSDDRAHDDVVEARIKAHRKRASSASTAARVRTSFSRRRMSWTLMPCTGRTSMFGMLRAARP